MKIFCISIFPENFKFFKKMKLTPVGLLRNNFDKRWMGDRVGNSISEKNKYLGEYTFHYWIWKNYLDKLKNEKWIGFCEYRRFWVQKKSKIKNFDDLLKYSIKKPLKEWSNCDAILTEKIEIGKIKKMKIIKNYGILNSFRKLNYFFKEKHTAYEHSSIFHGQYNIDSAINCLDKKNAKRFKEYLSSYEFSFENMFIVKNSDILKAYYESVFFWLNKLSKKINIYKFQGYKIRMLAFMAERYLPFWMTENCKIYENRIKFMDTHYMLNKSKILKKLNS